MRVPVKSETDAFWLTYGLALLVGVSVVLGVVASPLAGVAVLVGGVVCSLVLEFSTRDRDRPQPLREASQSMPVASADRGNRKRILVVANQTAGGDELKAEILERGEPRPELRIVVPVLCSRSHHLTSDIDREIAEAQARLDVTLRWAREQGFEAVGTVGDANPLIAIEDELSRFGADELIVSTFPPERSNWLEHGVVERAREELDMPVRHVVVDIPAQESRAAELAA
jgi:GABA permease